MSNIEILTNWLVPVGMVLGSVSYFGFSIVKGVKRAETAKDNTVEKSNQMLRDLISDQDIKIDEMVKKTAVLLGEVRELRDEVLALTSRNSGLEKLITDSLFHYFRDHPDVAGTLKQSREYKSK